MNANSSVLVSGASGNVGAALVAALRDAGVAVVATTTSRQHAVEALPLVRRLDFEDASTFTPALEGVRHVFLMRPPQISDTKRFIRPFISAMAAAGVEHVVFLSLMGVNRAMPHWQIEQDLRASSLSWTFLRPSFFAQNLGGAYAEDIRDRDRIHLASGRGRTSFVDTRDVAAVAAQVLAAPQPHRRQAYTLTGPEAFDYRQVASLLSVALGRAITYEPIGLLRYRRELLARSLPNAFVNVQLLINIVARIGLAKRIDDTLPSLLGRPATPLAVYIRDHRNLWMPRPT